jgi:plastocyanin
MSVNRPQANDVDGSSRRERRAGPARAGLKALALLVLLGAGLGQATAATHTVTISGMAFSPVALHVKRGDRIAWVNEDPFPHTVTAKDRTFDSGNIAAGKRWTFSPSSSGRFDYICTLHPVMTGTVEVE